MIKQLIIGTIITVGTINSPKQPTEPTIEQINAFTPQLCEAINYQIATGPGTATDVVIANQLLYMETWPDSDPFIEGYYFGIIVGCAAD